MPVSCLLQATLIKIFGVCHEPARLHITTIGSKRGPLKKSRGELSFMDSYQLCAPRSPLQIFEMRMCCLLIS
jgi:hypothetical protein